MTAPAQAPTPAADLAYALRWRVRGQRPGAHRGADTGPMGHFRRVVPFDRSPDARRIDLRASLRDPFGLLQVRQFEQRTAAEVYALLDLSGSMAFGDGARWRRAVRLCELLAAAAADIHDSFGLAAGAGQLALFERARRHGIDGALARLRSMTPDGRQSGALLAAAEQLGRRRKLVFLVSDFDFPLDQAEDLLVALSAHDVVPVAIGDRAREHLPRHGLVELADLEDGRRRLVWLRPSLHQRWREQARQRSGDLDRVCRRHGRQPFRVDGELDVDALCRHLLEG